MHSPLKEGFKINPGKSSGFIESGGRGAKSTKPGRFYRNETSRDFSLSSSLWSKWTQFCGKVNEVRGESISLSGLIENTNTENKIQKIDTNTKKNNNNTNTNFRYKYR